MSDDPNGAELEVPPPPPEPVLGGVGVGTGGVDPGGPPLGGQEGSPLVFPPGIPLGGIMPVAGDEVFCPISGVAACPCATVLAPALIMDGEYCAPIELLYAVEELYPAGIWSPDWPCPLPCGVVPPMIPLF